MWTVTAGKEKQSNGAVVAILTFADGTRTIQERFDVQGGVTDDFLAQRAKAKISWLNAQDFAFSNITEGALIPKDVPPIVPVPPTQDEIDRNQFLTDFHLQEKMKKAVAAGLMTVDSKEFTDLDTRIKSGFKIAYLDFI